MADAVQKELGLEVDWPGLKTALLTATTRLHDKLAVLKALVTMIVTRKMMTMIVMMLAITKYSRP